MSSICFYFQVHQPYRLKKYSVFDIGQDHEYFKHPEEEPLNNKFIFNKVAEKCYLKTNKLLLRLLKEHPEFKVAFSISGVFLDQAEEFDSSVIKSFVDLVKTGQVEILEETYYHSLAFIFSKDEFRKQVLLHRQKVKELFGVEPKVFRNTELIYNNELAKEISQLGYTGILLEGANKILGWRNPNFVYQAKDSGIKLLTRNYKFSDDIGFRFSDKNWDEHPLSAKKYASWVEKEKNAQVINIFVDYETFGEHQWEESGIFNFLNQLPKELIKSGNDFIFPSEALEKYPSQDELDIPDFISWADEERDLSAWLSNPMQHEAFKKLYDLEKRVNTKGDNELTEDWRKMQTSDHFYYMCTKFFADGDVHKYFNPYQSPYEAFINYMNVLNDLKFRLEN